MYLKRTGFLPLFVFALFRLASAQPEAYNHPELDWYTIETAHFYVHYHAGTERTARATAGIAEDIYGPITSFYDYVPDTKIHFVVRDHDDYSNGFAAYYDNKIEIWAPAMDFAFRGTHNWLRNTLTHEYSHIISMGAVRKMPRQIPAIYLQWLGYEKEKRSDVIHGYPNTLVSVPLPGTVIPLWFAEGMAQFQRAGLDYEIWDSHRDMLQRTAVRSGTLQSLEQMCHFRKSSLDNERGAYNQGYGLTLYIAHRYGEEAVARLAQSLRKLTRYRFNGAVREVLGISEKELYAGWKSWLEAGYTDACRVLDAHAVQGRLIQDRGFSNIFPRWTSNDSSIVFLSNEGRDYLYQTRLLQIDPGTGKKKKIAGGVRSGFSFSPGGRSVVYAKLESRTRQGSHYLDLYVKDLKTGREKKITENRRARYPAWSGDGRCIAAIVEQDGTSNIVLLDPDGKNIKNLTRFHSGEYLFSVQWTADGSRLLADMYETGHGRDIVMIDTAGGNVIPVLAGPWDERDPFPGPGGKWLYYASDETGIFNIWRINPETREKQLLTNVPGGAFMPSVRKDGGLVFSRFDAGGYKLAVLDDPEPVPVALAAYVSPYRIIMQTNRSRNQWPISAYDDRKSPEYESVPYKPIYSKLIFLPRITMDYPRRLKFGTYFYSSDFLNRMSIFGTAAVNTLGDVDAFLFFNNRQLYPTLFLEGYYQLRHVNDSMGGDVAFNLAEVDIGADWQLTDENILRTAYIFSMYNAASKWQDQGILFKFAYTYHIGHVFQARWTHEAVPPSLFSYIAPRRGRRFTLDLQRAYNRFLNDFEVHGEYGTLVEKYNHHHFTQISLDWQEFKPGLMRDHGIAARLRLGFIDQPVDSFYHFFAGGLTGMKGYPFYSIEGRKLAHLSLAYRLPLAKRINRTLLFMQLNTLYLSVYGDLGHAWNSKIPDLSEWKKDVGVQLRLGFMGFYDYPMTLFWDAAYGIDAFTQQNQTYGKAWRFYFGVLFDFLD